MSDVRVLLKSLAKVSREKDVPRPFLHHVLFQWEQEKGGLQGVDGYFCLYKRYSEVMSSVVRQLLHESLTPEKIIQIHQKLQQLLLQTCKEFSF